MPLVIDSSTPAAHITNQTTATNTCAAFTPPSDPLLLVLYPGDTTGGTGPATPSISSSPAQTWTLDGYDYRDTGSPTLDGQTAAWHSSVGGSPGSTTVSVVNHATSGFLDSVLMVLVFTGHDPAAPVGATDHNRQSSGTSLSDSYTATIDGGQGFMVISDWSGASTAAWTPATGCDFVQSAGTDLVGSTFGMSYAVIQRATADGVAGASTTLGLTGLTAGGQYHWVMVEVISLEAAAKARRVIVDGSSAANL